MKKTISMMLLAISAMFVVSVFATSKSPKANKVTMFNPAAICSLTCNANFMTCMSQNGAHQNGDGTWTIPSPHCSTTLNVCLASCPTQE